LEEYIVENDKKNTRSEARKFFDSLFQNNEAANTQTRSLIGHIDSLENRRLSGRVVDNEDKDAVVEFEVYIGGPKLGEGSAKTYRRDLEEAGYVGGKHGFSVELNSKVFSADASTLVLCEKKSGIRVSTIVASVTDIHNSTLYAVVHAGVSNMPKSVEVLVDSTMRLPCAISNKSGRDLRCECRLPSELFDDMPHTCHLAKDVREFTTGGAISVFPGRENKVHEEDSCAGRSIFRSSWA